MCSGSSWILKNSWLRYWPLSASAQASANSCQRIEADCSTHLVLPHNTTGGAIASSEGTQQGCRLPLSALHPLTREYHPWRPAAVLQYGVGHRCGPRNLKDVQGAFHLPQAKAIQQSLFSKPLIASVHCWPLCRCQAEIDWNTRKEISNWVLQMSTSIAVSQQCRRITRS